MTNENKVYPSKEYVRVVPYRRLSHALDDFGRVFIHAAEKIKDNANYVERQDDNWNGMGDHLEYFAQLVKCDLRKLEGALTRLDEEINGRNDK